MAVWDTVERKKPWAPPVRNYKNIRHEHIRREVDGRFVDAKDQLSYAYFREWRYGRSYPILGGFDVQADLSQTEVLYRKLKVLLDDLYLIEFHTYNTSLPPEQQVPQSSYDYEITDEATGAVIDTTLALAERRAAATQADLERSTALSLPAQRSITD